MRELFRICDGENKDIAYPLGTGGLAFGFYLTREAAEMTLKELRPILEKKHKVGGWHVERIPPELRHLLILDMKDAGLKYVQLITLHSTGDLATYTFTVEQFANNEDQDFDPMPAQDGQNIIKKTGP
jgi:hypothetical protein